MHLVVVLIKVLVVKLYTDAHGDVSRPYMYVGCSDFSKLNQPMEVSQSKVAIQYFFMVKQSNIIVEPYNYVSWYNKYPWITVCTSKYKIYCRVCCIAKQQKFLSPSV